MLNKRYSIYIFIYSIAYWGEQAGADVVAGGVSPAFSLIYDVAKDIMNIAIPKLGHSREEGVKHLVTDFLPQRLGTSISRSQKTTTKSPSELLVRPPSLPNL